MLVVTCFAIEIYILKSVLCLNFINYIALKKISDFFSFYPYLIYMEY